MKKYISHAIWISLHGWLGLFNGVWLLMLGISGSLYVYAAELDEWFNRDLLTVVPLERRMPVDSLYRIVHKKYPTAFGTNIIHFPRKPTDRIGFGIYTQEEEKPMTQWYNAYYMDMDPYTGRILREANYRDINASFLLWITGFHWSLNFGNIGILLVTIAGLLLFMNVVTGIIIYRKFLLPALIFRAPIEWRNWYTISLGLHRYIGVWSMVFNILVFYTGLQMNWSVFDKSSWTQPVKAVKNTAAFASIDRMMSEVQEIYPGFEMHHFYIPFNKIIVEGVNVLHASAQGIIPGTPSIVPRNKSHVNFDVNTGQVTATVDANQELAKMNWWDKFNYVAHSFHAGTFAGEFSRILYVILGLTPAFLSVSGFMLWWRRKGQKSKTN